MFLQSIFLSCFDSKEEVPAGVFAINFSTVLTVTALLLEGVNSWCFCNPFLSCFDSMEEAPAGVFAIHF